MSVVSQTRLYTPDDLLTMPDGDRYELVGGQLVEQNVSVWSSFVAGTIYGFLWLFNRSARVGWLFPEGTTYQCFPRELGKIRKPDVSFIRLARLSLVQFTSEGHCTVTPDFAVEVLSPRDAAWEVDTKVQSYLDAGVSIVWVVSPVARTVVVHRREGQGSVLREHDELACEDILPGFHCRVAEIFKFPTDEQPA